MRKMPRTIKARTLRHLVSSEDDRKLEEEGLV